MAVDAVVSVAVVLVFRVSVVYSELLRKASRLVSLASRKQLRLRLVFVVVVLMPKFGGDGVCLKYQKVTFFKL